MKKFKRTRKGKVYKPAEERKKGLSTATIFAIVIIGIMVLSGIGFIWEGGNSFKYNNIKFKVVGDSYIANINGKNVEFFVPPDNVEMINVSKGAIQAIKNTKMVYMTSDPEGRFANAIAKVEYDMKETFAGEGIYALYAFTGENAYNITQITCGNATASVPVIYFMNSTETSITYDNGCIMFNSPTEFGFVALRDRLMYSFYGIME